MFSSVAFYINLNENSNNAKRKRREVRKRAENVLDLPDAVFIKQFRINKSAFKYLLDILKNELPPSVRSTNITPEIKLATFLRFIAEGGYQNGTGKDFNVGLAQPTVSVVLSEVLNIFERRLCPEWITLEMSDVEQQEARTYFYRKCNMPGIIMCVDGTHIKIFKPCGTDAHHYYNRKGFYSLNVMIICDHKQRIRYVDAKYPGATHDSFIWRNSDASFYFKSIYDRGARNVRILGDSGYPLLPWLITPFRNAGFNTPKSRFNKAHSTGRNVVERTIGLWKNWCRCLLGARQLHYSPQKAAQIINVAAALHSIRLHYNVEEEYTPIQSEDDGDEVENADEIPGRYNDIANEIRNEILRNFI